MDINQIVSSKQVSRVDATALIRSHMEAEADLHLLKCFMDVHPHTIQEASVAADVCCSTARAWLKPFTALSLIEAVPTGLRGPGAPKLSYQSSEIYRSIVRHLATEQGAQLEEFFGLRPEFSAMTDLKAQPSREETRYFCQCHMHLVAPFIKFVVHGHIVRGRGPLALLACDALLAGPLSRPAIAAALDLPRASRSKLLGVLKGMQTRFGLLDRVGAKFRINPEKRLLIYYARK